jgi:transglutaminase-like putative cysteine protease
VLGHVSLGARSRDVTKVQHCRAEVDLYSHGWAPVDPADVRKVILEEPPGNLSLESNIVGTARMRLFGSWETNWMAYNFAHDVALAGSREGNIPFLMYPQTETAAGRVDSLDTETFAYRITADEIAPRTA